MDSFTGVSRDTFLPVTVRALTTGSAMCLIWERLVGFLVCNMYEEEILAKAEVLILVMLMTMFVYITLLKYTLYYVSVCVENTKNHNDVGGHRGHHHS